MKSGVVLALSLGMLFLCSTAVCQTAGSAVAYSPPELVHLAEQMRAEVKSTAGAGTGLFEKRLDNSTILALRNKDGSAEAHEQSEDVFFVLKGNATLVSGGAITRPVTTARGEIRGTTIQQGSRRDLKEGDIVHIPAGVPHQLLVPTGSSFTYFIVKVPLK